MAIHAQMFPENLGLPLCGSQDLIENGCGFKEFSFNLEQKQQHQLLLQFQNQQRRKNQFLDSEKMSFFPPPGFYTATGSTSASAAAINNNDRNTSNLPPVAISRSIAAQFEYHRQEINRFINFQSNRLKLMMQEHSRQQLASLLREFEAKSAILLRQKEEEIARNINRAAELEGFAKQMETENQVWQRVAAENEAMITSLNATLNQMKREACFFSTVDDAESCCGEGGATENRGDGGAAATAFAGERKMLCRICSLRISCVVFLPCRHLCSCKECEAFLEICPVCTSQKEGTMEALFS
ncbi:hypothetical protein Nepgr_018202 [Nepenthes gracilis]|uniref:RING-type domain-containing protein n=1 Tax=Nepenthes gracilis TaxID=150966 RepID=A0AAD3ST98_NEPGR|nr:hypothetical protein Nepgr_018202 [Nepenthes gracilis]